MTRTERMFILRKIYLVRNSLLGNGWSKCPVLTEKILTANSKTFVVVKLAGIEFIKFSAFSDLAVVNETNFSYFVPSDYTKYKIKYFVDIGKRE